VTRKELGLHAKWNTVKASIDSSSFRFEEKPKIPTKFKKKCPEILKLNCYKKGATEKFWDLFPKNTNKVFFQTPVNCKKLHQKNSPKKDSETHNYEFNKGN